MPSAPEFLDGQGKIWMVEVLSKIHAEETCRPSGQGGAGLEIGIKLEGIEDAGQKDQKTAVGIIIRKDGIYIDRRLVRDHHLEEKAPHDQQDGPEDPVEVKAVPSVEGLLQCVVSGYGTLDDLGEEGHEQEEFQGIFLAGSLSLIYVRQIGDQLQGIEGQAHRDDQGKAALQDPGKDQGIEPGQEKRSRADKDPQDQKEFFSSSFSLFDQDSETEGCRGGQPHHQALLFAADQVQEGQGAGKKDRPADLPWKNIVEDHQAQKQQVIPG